jgi:nicotinamide riboside kinase
MTKVINFISGPGVGKSTTAAYVFSMLKLNNINVELVTEYAKDKIWEGSLNVLENQIYVFGKQQHRLYRVRDKVDVVVMDSPLLLSAIYDKSQSELFKNLIIEEFNKYDNLNIFIERIKSFKYINNGRIQNEEESIAVDNKIKAFLNDNSFLYYSHIGSKDNLNNLLTFIMEYIDPNYV